MPSARLAQSGRSRLDDCVVGGLGRLGRSSSDLEWEEREDEE
jgi:hypothetical protein